MNRYLVYPTVALLLAACAPGPQQTDLEPVTPACDPGGDDPGCARNANRARSDDHFDARLGWHGFWWYGF